MELKGKTDKAINLVTEILTHFSQLLMEQADENMGRKTGAVTTVVHTRDWLTHTGGHPQPHINNHRDGHTPGHNATLDKSQRAETRECSLVIEEET